MAEIGRPRKAVVGVEGGKQYPCFTREALGRWRAMVAPADPQPCVDCTPEYRDQMMSEGRCLHPETLFARDSDGFVSGVNRLDPSWAPMSARAAKGVERRLVPRDAELFGQDGAQALENSPAQQVSSRD